MARVAAPENQRKLFTVRVANLPSTLHNDEELLNEFSRFGEIGDFYRPTLLNRHKASSYAFIRYVNEKDGLEAIQEMDQKHIWDVDLSVAPAAQPVFFTKDTGFLTNYELNVPPREPEEFDSSMPESHYSLKRKEDLRTTDDYFTVRVDDLHPSICKEHVEEIFSQFGEVARVYFPVDLAHNCHPRGFAFVRYLREGDARRAAETLNGLNLGIGRNITVRLNCQRTYFSQDESAPPKPRRKPAVAMHINP